jgi:coenzyme F420-0:L-glutamate ligase / coenzyme F420-1:gamma-L-glutamate ligase
LIQILPVKISADIQKGDNLAQMVISNANDDGINILEGDIIVVAQKMVSKAEGRIVGLEDIMPSKKARKLARSHNKDPRLVQVIIQESRRLVRARHGILITETQHGFICANSGVDQSNIPGESQVILLPVNSDDSAYEIMRGIKKIAGKSVAVVITDTFGRPFRNGQTNVAIGVAGMEPIESYVGSLDMYGKVLRVTEIAVADEIASAAELVMGKTKRVPVAIVRGYKFKPHKKSSIQLLIRDKKRDLFR